MMTFQCTKPWGVSFSFKLLNFICRNVNEQGLFIYAEAVTTQLVIRVKSISNYYVTSANSSTEPNDKFLEHFRQRENIMNQLAQFLEPQ